MACLIDDNGRIAVVVGHSSMRSETVVWVVDKRDRSDSYADQ